MENVIYLLFSAKTMTLIDRQAQHTSCLYLYPREILIFNIIFKSLFLPARFYYLNNLLPKAGIIIVLTMPLRRTVITLKFKRYEISVSYLHYFKYVTDDVVNPIYIYLFILHANCEFISFPCFT